MATQDTDDEPIRWTSIGWQAALILNRLRNKTSLKADEQKNEQRQRDADREKVDEEKAEEKRRYIDQRLRDLATFERRVSGDIRQRARRKSD